VKATEVTAGLAESNGSLLPGLWRDSLHVTCGLTACTLGSAPGPTLGNEYGKTLPLPSGKSGPKDQVALHYAFALVHDLRGIEIVNFTISLALSAGTLMASAGTSVPPSAGPLLPLPLPYCTAARHSDFAFLRLLFDMRLSHLINITYIHTYVVQNIHIVVFVSYRTARRRAVTTVARHRAAGAR